MRPPTYLFRAAKCQLWISVDFETADSSRLQDCGRIHLECSLADCLHVWHRHYCTQSSGAKHTG
jgi:hypothetical protein